MARDDYLDYNRMLEGALMSIVKNALKQVSNAGLSGEHYFFITFKTSARGTVIPDFLLRQYPETLTIIIQYEYSNLSVSEHEFGVTLSFNNKNYHIIVPFHSIMAFADPSVNFSLTFNPQEEYSLIPDDEPELSFRDSNSNIIPISDFISRSVEPDDVA